MFTQEYFHTLTKSQLFHKGSVNWAGDGTWQYVNETKNAVKNYHCESMLDYGCGKGSQYPKFANSIGIKSYGFV